MRQVYEADSTVQIDLRVSPYAVPLDAAPVLHVAGLAPVTAQQSAANAFYAILTTPTSEGTHLATWMATSSGFNFTSRFLFEVRRTNLT